MKKAIWALGRQRLLFLAAVLDIADKGHELVDERTYNQNTFVHPCGAPACALGHYAAQFPRRFRLRAPDNDVQLGAVVPTDAAIYSNEYRYGIGTDNERTIGEFAISYFEADELCAAHGCGGARKAVDAAAYIRKFVARKDRKLRAAKAKRKAR